MTMAIGNSKTAETYTAGEKGCALPSTDLAEAEQKNI
jgi:hypothetical protein